MDRRLYVFFLLSGASGLIYQIIWVREFGNVFGNTIQSASLVIAVFMLGLGAGSRLAGRWADGRHLSGRGSLVAAYGLAEIAIGVLGLLVSTILPRLGEISSHFSWYTRGPDGWFVLSTGSYLARYAVAVVMLAPVTLLMGATLTLLIRHAIRDDLAPSGWRIASLYAANTAGAAAGCFLTDFTLIPGLGLRNTQLLAVALNIVSGAGALHLARSRSRSEGKGRAPLGVSSPGAPPTERYGGHALPSETGGRLVLLAALAIFASGFGAMGMEILWFRHIATILGDYRSVISLVLTVVLAGIGLGALAGGALTRRSGRAALLYIATQASFVVFTLAGFGTADAGRFIASLLAAKDAFFASSGTGRAALELWLSARPLLAEIGLPAILMGFSFPLANAMVQKVEGTVGRRAGSLYLANTLGAVLGSLAAGFVLLPRLGLQSSVGVLAVILVAGLAPLLLAMRSAEPPPRRSRRLELLALALAGGAAAAAGLWIGLPSDHVLLRAIQLRPGEKILAVSEGVNQVVTVTEMPGGQRSIWTNGYSIAATGRMAQRYMRAFAHIPLLTMAAPERVLVICFGVGNTAHAASLHESVRRLEVVELSREVLAQAGAFAATNGNVLMNPKVSVFVNDGRHHMLMQAPTSYDLITLEPPPIAFAGVGSLYSREFYELARSRLKPKGCITQWLPAYQVDERATLAMVRAFVEVFPHCVLLSGAYNELILYGSPEGVPVVDPARLQERLSAAPTVRRDLERVDLGTLTELIGTFAGSAETLAGACGGVPPLVDDRPLLEYSTRSRLWDHTIPATMFDVTQLQSWCPSCFSGDRPAPGLQDLHGYLALLGGFYKSPAFLRYTWPPLPGLHRFAVPLDPETRRIIAGSGYLSSHFRASAPEGR